MKKIIILAAVVVATFISCETQEGRGGTSTITGTVMIQQYNKDLTIAVGKPYPAQEYDVYIIYGSDEVYGDRFRTGYDGKYEFDYLQEGKYTIYALSKSLDNRLTNELVPIFREVDITGKNQKVVVDTITIID